MRFVSFSEVAETFRGRRVAVVGSGPSCTENVPGVIDGYDVVVRVNGYKLGAGQGFKTDVHYSFYGNSIRKTAYELTRDGVSLCMCKCPDRKPIQSEWHERNGKTNGIDFRYIYAARQGFWFCDTFIPDAERFMRKVGLLGGHIPTTGFAAILDVMDCEPAELFLTGFDGFTSGLHNVNEHWRAGNPEDPIGHVPALELEWIKRHVGSSCITIDRKLRHVLEPQ